MSWPCEVAGRGDLAASRSRGLLDTYASGRYDSAIQAALLPSPTLIPDLRAAFAHDAAAWAARGGPEHLARRRLIAATIKELPAMPLGGEARVVDCLAEAWMIPGMAGRRHLFIVQTTGLDFVSATVPARLPDLAMRSDAVVDLALTGQFQNPVMDALLDTARLTGGHQGAHTITVGVMRPETFTIGARRGYVDQ